MTTTVEEAPKASVLVVDDTPENIDVLTELLKPDYKVRAAVDGPTALALVRRFPPDIVLLDVMMPAMSGYEVCAALRDDPLTVHIPVIFITAMNEVDNEKKGFDLGAVDYITKPFSPPLVQARVRNHLALQDRRRALEQEVQSRTRELADSNAALANEIILRTRAMERAEYLFNFDPLTGLPNRRQFMDRLERLVGRAGEDGSKLALVGISLDRFNVVKTALGGAMGDQMLVQTGQRLQQSLHPSDLLARTGGEEFAAAVSLHSGHDAGAADRAREVSLQLRTSLTSPFDLAGGVADVRASAAYAVYPEDGASAIQLMRHMETTLEHVKRAGGNRAERFDKTLDRAAGAEFAVELRIREALRDQVFVPYYQPKVATGTGRVMGAETLVRWPVAGGMISPAKFIPVAERSGLIGAIDQFMLEQTCRQVAQWATRFKDFRVAVNISASAFQSDTLVADVVSALDRTGARAEHLEFEITEHALITDLNIAIGKLNALRDLGAHISLDDFGTGYSSMS
jgi:diguanylate cyclase (GGDEF)-like protein